MPKWKPEKIWDGEETFIIGGGDSLKNFNWNLLKPLLTIGCNDAYKLGSDICKICFFGDSNWFEKHEQRLKAYNGVVFTNSGKIMKQNIPWVWSTMRKGIGLHQNAVGWNKNTGAAAVNLAMLLGAKTIFLLGFDMQLSKDGKSNWHENEVSKPNPKIYDKFITGFDHVNNGLSKFPGVEVVNITDNSRLEFFPKIGVNEFWSRRAG